MNEQIRKLALASGLINYIDNETPRRYFISGDGLPDCEKVQRFARLIVLECIDLANHSNVTGKSIIGERIKEHFGVQE